MSVQNAPVFMPIVILQESHMIQSESIYPMHTVEDGVYPWEWDRGMPRGLSSHGRHVLFFETPKNLGELT